MPTAWGVPGRTEPASDAPDSTDASPLSPREQARSLSRLQAGRLVAACLSLESSQRCLVGVAEPAPWAEHLLDDVARLSDLSRQLLAAYADQWPATAWARSLSPVGPLVAAGLAAKLAGLRLPGADYLRRVCGQHPATQHLSLAEATRLFHRFHRDARQILLADAKALAAATGRNLPGRWREGDPIAKDDALAWLAAPPCSRLLKGLLDRVGQECARPQARPDNRFTRAYAERLLLEQRLNDASAHTELARRDWERGRWASRDEAACLLAGRLPAATLEARARQWAVRQFLIELHRKLDATTEPDAPDVRETEPERE